MNARVAIAIGALFMLASCSGGGPTEPTPSSLTVSCDTTGLTEIGQQGSCSARLTLTNSTTHNQQAGVQWSSSDSAKVRVTSSGIITAVAPGSAEIRALYSGLSDSEVIAVTVACAFSVSPTTVSFASGGGTQNVTLTVAPEDCSASTWTTSSSSAALTVLPSSGSGSATISLTATANRGSAQTWTATVAGQNVTAMIAAAPPPPPRPRTLTLTLEQGENLSGPYRGTVTGPNGFTCTLLGEQRSKSCPSAQFSDGETVTLNATLLNAPGDKPIWREKGCDSVTSRTCTLRMTANRSVTLWIGCTSCTIHP